MKQTEGHRNEAKIRKLEERVKNLEELMKITEPRLAGLIDTSSEGNGGQAADQDEENKDIFFIIDYETTGVDIDDVPIEVGIVVTDSEFDELDSYENLIFSHEAGFMPDQRWKPAEKIHGISKKQMKDEGITPQTVATYIKELASKWKPENGRVILLSDNIQFEWRHTEWLLNHIGAHVTTYFHYCGWDTSVLSLFTEFRDPKGTKHRALSDAQGLRKELKKAYNIVNF